MRTMMTLRYDIAMIVCTAVFIFSVCAKADTSPYVFYTKGEEGLPPLDVAKNSIIGGGAVVQLNDHLGLRIDISHEDRKDFYIHNAFGVGLSVFF
jgi:hypothetical protein